MEIYVIPGLPGTYKGELRCMFCKSLAAGSRRKWWEVTRICLGNIWPATRKVWLDSFGQ